MHNNTLSALEQMVPFLFLLTMNYVAIPALLQACAYFCRPWNTDDKVRIRFLGNYIFTVVLMFCLPLLNVATVWDFVSVIVSEGKPQLHFDRCAEFSLQYLISSSLTGALFDLFQFSQSIYLFVFRGVDRWDFEFGEAYAIHLAACTLALTFSPINSALLPLGCLYFAVRYLVDQYLFEYGVRKCSVASDGWTEELILRVFLSQVSVFLGVISFAFPYFSMRLSLHTLAIFIAAMCLWPSLFIYLPKEPSRRDEQIFRIPNMGRFLRLLSVSYRAPFPLMKRIVSIPEGFTDSNYPWYLSIIK